MADIQDLKSHALQRDFFNYTGFDTCSYFGVLVGNLKFIDSIHS
jgi:hypothetical protein